MRAGDRVGEGVEVPRTRVSDGEGRGGEAIGGERRVGCVRRWVVKGWGVRGGAVRGRLRPHAPRRKVALRKHAHNRAHHVDADRRAERARL